MVLKVVFLSLILQAPIMYSSLQVNPLIKIDRAFSFFQFYIRSYCQIIQVDFLIRIEQI